MLRNLFSDINVDKTTVNELTRRAECRPAANDADQPDIETVSVSPPTYITIIVSHRYSMYKLARENARRQLIVIT